MDNEGFSLGLKSLFALIAGFEVSNSSVRLSSASQASGSSDVIKICGKLGLG